METLDRQMAVGPSQDVTSVLSVGDRGHGRLGPSMVKIANLARPGYTEERVQLCRLVCLIIRDRCHCGGRPFTIISVIGTSN